ncbi:MAG: hypothetical protein JOZ39_07125 [Chloroflexi bacterium]|nr:hypothetical protein [Chloroflexota bacterium]
MIAKPVVDGIERQLDGKLLHIVRIDVSSGEGRKIAAHTGIDLVPTFIGYDGAGRERWRTQQATRAELMRKIASL